MKTHSESEENYIKALYHLGGGEAVSNGALAQRVGAKGPSATQAVKRLAAKGLAEVIPYKGVKLTSDGLALAKHILRKHRLWETFLVEKLGFGWEEVQLLIGRFSNERLPGYAAVSNTEQTDVGAVEPTRSFRYPKVVE